MEYKNKPYLMYVIHDIMFYSHSEAESLADGKSEPLLRFIVSDKPPVNGSYVYTYPVYKTREEAMNYIEEEE